MLKRPNIPAEIRRQIFVEAGHRCAIQTCRNTANLDIHHIIPWEKCKEHTLENLITLCPNCHSLADGGKIDRMSLRKYKEICRNLIKPPYPPPIDRIWAFIEFNPHSVPNILDSSNVCSITDNGVLDFTFCFDEPFEDLDYIVNAVATSSVTFKFFNKTLTSIQIVFDEPCPNLVKLQFKY